MPDEHFIKYIEINNFKCFDYLKVDNLKRVNLLGGDNNIGKSAFLEALEAISKAQNANLLIMTLSDIINRRQVYNIGYSEFDLISYEKDGLTLKTNTTSINLEIKSEINPQLSLFQQSAHNNHDGLIDENVFVAIKINNDYYKTPYSRFSSIINRRVPTFPLRNAKPNENIDFINSTLIDEKKLSSIYGYIVDMGMMDTINIFLREFDPRIEFLIIRPTERYSVFKIKLKNKKEPVLLSSMGEGLNRYIAIVCAIRKSTNGQLFIDEVENGIHYTKYEKLWEIIFKTSLEANCQLFITSHSKECIEVFSKVAERYDYENIKYVNFSKFQEKNQIIKNEV